MAGILPLNLYGLRLRGPHTESHSGRGANRGTDLKPAHEREQSEGIAVSTLLFDFVLILLQLGLMRGHLRAQFFGINIGALYLREDVLFLF